MVHCCVQGCKNTHHYKGRIKDAWSGAESLQQRNYSLHDLPGEDRKEIRDLWILAINRCALPKDVAVCSDHFTEDCFDEKWEEYKRLYGPTKVKRKLKLDAVPTVFPGRFFVHEKVQMIKESWKNKSLQREIEQERLRIEREYKDRFKYTQTDCTCKCRCRKRRRDFSQQVNFSFKFMEDVGVQFPGDADATQSVKNDHAYVNVTKKERDRLRKKKIDDQEEMNQLIQGAISHISSHKSAFTSTNDCEAFPHDMPHNSADVFSASFSEAIGSIRDSLGLLQSAVADPAAGQLVDAHSSVFEVQEAAESISIGVEGSDYESDMFSNEASSLSSPSGSLNIDLESAASAGESKNAASNSRGRHRMIVEDGDVNLVVGSKILSGPAPENRFLYSMADKTNYQTVDLLNSARVDSTTLGSGEGSRRINHATPKRLRLDPSDGT